MILILLPVLCFAVVSPAPAKQLTIYDSLVKECPTIANITEFSKQDVITECTDNVSSIEEVKQWSMETSKDVLCLLYYNSVKRLCATSKAPSRSQLMPNVSAVSNMDVCKDFQEIYNLTRGILNQTSCESICTVFPKGKQFFQLSFLIYKGIPVLPAKEVRSDTKIPKGVVPPKSPAVVALTPEITAAKTKPNPAGPSNPPTVSESMKKPAPSTEGAEQDPDIIPPFQNIPDPAAPAPAGQPENPSKPKNILEKLKQPLVTTPALKQPEVASPEEAKTPTVENKVEKLVTDVKPQVPDQMVSQLEDNQEVKPPELGNVMDLNPKLQNEDDMDGLEREESDYGGEEAMQEMNAVKGPEKSKVATAENISSEDLDGESDFFSYFMVICLLVVLGYVAYHNRQKVFALMLEGKRGKRQQRGRRPNSANYHKLDSNLEEAITSDCSKSTSHIIY